MDVVRSQKLTNFRSGWRKKFFSLSGPIQQPSPFYIKITNKLNFSSDWTKVKAMPRDAISENRLLNRHIKFFKTIFFMSYVRDKEMVLRWKTGIVLIYFIENKYFSNLLDRKDCQWRGGPCRRVAGRPAGWRRSRTRRGRHRSSAPR